ncbi:ATP-binding protein [Limnohabitans sp. Rim28]|uniref:hybrid sensor histidine kinase/response regulator n=1 Tax=Limnohabitans sp. Rim28 TaxID=1100720 RepID=UPI00031704EE|nr:ATP-binding protein [Limnohabitans sp. Rim28]PVE05434.1 hybrid sensor histidine kinase/response regulator [Limnohabitans sp. Rim28]
MPMMSRSHASKTAWIWLGWAVVVLVLWGLSLLYGLSLHQQQQASAWRQAEAVTKMIGVRILGRLQHMDDIMLHTQDAFNRFGPGLTGKDTMLRSRNTIADLHHVVILNAAGDPILSVPPGLDTRDYSALIDRAVIATKTDVFSFGWAEASGAVMARAMNLQFEDGTFAGAVAVLTPAAWIGEALSEPARAYGLSIRLLLHAQPLAQDQGASDWTQQAGLVREFEVMPGEMTLQVRLRQDELDRQWWDSFKAIAVVVSFSCMALLLGALWLHRAVVQQMRSAVAAEISAKEALVKARFLANMSHELRTPMTGVLGAVELLHDTQPSSAQRSLLSLIESSGRHLMNILNDVLDVSRMDFNAMQLELEPGALLQVLEDVSQVLMPKARLQGIALYAHLDLHESVNLRMDVFRLTQVLTNLLGNAIKFTMTGHVVLHAWLQQEDERLCLKIELTDTGIGIDAHQMQTLFQPFSQADLSTSRRFGGSGLGLLISKRLVELMGGQIGVDSRLGQGSRFWVDIPVDAQDMPPMPAMANLGMPSHVLLCVSDPLLRRSLQIHLHRLAVEPVICDVAQAIQSPVQCLLMDGDMLRQGVGWDLGDKQVLRVLSDAQTLQSEEVPVARQGHEAVLVEPIRRADLASMLRQLCGAVAEPEPQEPLDSASAPSHALKGLSVLVAEDNPVTQKILQMFMKSMGCDAVFVGDGQQAIDVARERSFDVVLMDCHMPGIDGYAAARVIRESMPAHAGQRHLPIIALTAATMPEDVRLAMAAGMDEVCSKPINRKLLSERLMYWRQRRERPVVDVA